MIVAGLILSPGMTDNPRPRIRWVITLPKPQPPISDRTCMPYGPAWPRRLTRQIVPRTSLRDCCWDHSVHWRKASAVAVRLTRQLRQEKIAGAVAIRLARAILRAPAG